MIPSCCCCILTALCAQSKGCRTDTLCKGIFRHLTGRSNINATALQRIIPLYNPRAYRYLSKARILDALDTAIATRGAFFPIHFLWICRIGSSRIRPTEKDSGLFITLIFT
ncbi:plasmid SOS inhibition protein A [Aeromonas hydrophila]|uniref:Plasmid SOS inhibition protein A n=1 Tax=Aeromonas hydrophila TaxID=644 RepID=A0A926IZ70_AERHY|nr:plasmid SOS inhibition protein A [Aeromonas hydrophila]